MNHWKNTGFLAAGQFLPLAATFLLLPDYLRAIGAERFGVLVLTTAALTHLNLLDLGLGRSVAKFLAQSGAPQHIDPSNRALVKNAMARVALVGLFVGVACALLFRSFAHRLDLPQGLRMDELVMSIDLLALILPITLIYSVLSGFVGAMGRFRLLGLCTGLIGIGALAVPVLCAHAGFVGLPALVFATHLPWMLCTGILLWRWHVLCSSAAPGVGNRARHGESAMQILYQYGYGITLSQALSTAISALDRIVIAALLGPAAVSFFGIPQGLVSRALTFAGAASQALFPTLSNSSSIAHDDLTDRISRQLLYIATPVAAFAIVGLHTFWNLWLGPASAEAMLWVGELLIVAAWLQMGVAIYQTQILAAESPVRLSRLYAIELPIYALLLVGLTLRFGIRGAALAWLVRMTVDAVTIHLWAGSMKRQWRFLVGYASLLVVALGVRFFWGPQ